MTKLSTEDILRDKNTRDPDSITSLSLTHKALSDVSCLSDFKNLERLDLTFNNLSSLEGLELCLNLKWLSVQQNKLQSLKGIQGLINLTVLNAGKNKIRSMDEVKDLVKLRALILNDNEIASICGIDQLKELNTLVLSRNPIRKIGNSLAKLKSIAKISLSNCQLEAIDSSIKGCIELEQLRLAHNDIKALPAELPNKKLQILDLGNNMISKWSDLEVLSSLRNLRNLNLLGNPIAVKAKLVKKINKWVPGLQIFNAKRMDALNKLDKDGNPNSTMDIDLDKHLSKKELNKRHKLAKDKGVDVDDEINLMAKDKSGRKLKFKEHNDHVDNEKDHQVEEIRDPTKKKKNSKKTVTSLAGEGELDVTGNDGNNKAKKQKKHVEKEVLVQEADNKTDRRSKRKAEKGGLDVIDDKETPFSELLAYETTENMKQSDGGRRNNQAVRNIDSVSALVTFPTKKKKAKNQGARPSVLQFLNPAAEVGLGGPSAWDDE